MTKEQYQIIANLLSQVSVPVKDATVVIDIINKCVELSKLEDKKL